jgi:hypothetical protein
MGSSRRWLWFWVPLAVLAVVAIVLPIVYNLSLQLTAGELAQARARWREHGPKDYDLTCTVRFDDDTAVDRYESKVRSGEVVSFRYNDAEAKPHASAASGAASVADGALAAVWERPDVEGLFTMIERVLDEDAGKTGRRNYATASFDAGDGHPKRYVHRIAGTRQRQEWTITLAPPAEKQRSR